MTKKRRNQTGGQRTNPLRYPRSDLTIPRTLRSHRKEWLWAKTTGFIIDAATTNCIIVTINSNSLLHAFSSGGLTTYLGPACTNLLRTYASYRVHKYRLKVQMMSRAATNTYAMALLYETADTTYAPVSGTNLISQSAVAGEFSQMHLLPQTTTGSPTMKTIKSNKDIITILGRTDFLTDSDYAGSSNSSGVPTDPANLTYIYLALGGGGSWTASNSPLCIIELEQLAEFYDPRI